MPFVYLGLVSAQVVQLHLAHGDIVGDIMMQLLEPGDRRRHGNGRYIQMSIQLANL